MDGVHGSLPLRQQGRLATELDVAEDEDGPDEGCCAQGLGQGAHSMAEDHGPDLGYDAGHGVEREYGPDAGRNFFQSVDDGGEPEANGDDELPEVHGVAPLYCEGDEHEGKAEHKEKELDYVDRAEEDVERQIDPVDQEDDKEDDQGYEQSDERRKAGADDEDASREGDLPYEVPFTVYGADARVGRLRKGVPHNHAEHDQEAVVGNVFLKHEFGEGHTQSYDDHGRADQSPEEAQGSPFVLEGEFLDG